MDERTDGQGDSLGDQISFLVTTSVIEVGDRKFWIIFYQGGKY
jgi:hypothetical protein